MKRSNYILVFALCVAAATGLVTTAALMGEDNAHLRNISITGEQSTVSEVIQCKDLSLLPGKNRVYEVKVDFETGGTYNALIDFEEKKDGGLKGYVDVVVHVDGEAVYSGKLADLMQETVSFLLTPDSDDTIVMSLTYGMSESVGNEAQGASAAFDTRLTVGREINE